MVFSFDETIGEKKKKGNIECLRRRTTKDVDEEVCRVPCKVIPTEELIEIGVATRCNQLNPRQRNYT